MNRDKILNPEWLYPVRMGCVKAALELQEQEKAAYFLRLMPWAEEYRMQQYYPLLDQWKDTYAPHMAELLLDLPYDSQYLLLQRLFSLDSGTQEAQEEASSELFLFRRCLKEVEQPYLRQQLVKKALLDLKDFSILLEDMDLDTWKLCIEEVVGVIPYQDSSSLWDARKKLFAEYPLQGLWLEKLLWEKELTRGFRMKEALLEALEAYAGCIRAFYRKQYQAALFEGPSRSFLPGDCRMALALSEALDHWKQGRLTEALRLLRQALKLYPEMTGVVRELLRLLRNETEHPTPASGPEFEQLAVRMKAALKAMIESGQYAEAMPVLSQLLPLLPNDMELLRLQQILLARTVAFPSELH